MWTGLLSVMSVLAQGGGGSGGSNLMGTLFPMVFLFGIMYFLLIRPQQVKAKQHRELVSRLKAGDSVVTNGGIRGEIVGVKDQSVVVSVADGVEIEFIRTAIHTVDPVDGDSD